MSPGVYWILRRQKLARRRHTSEAPAAEPGRSRQTRMPQGGLTMAEPSAPAVGATGAAPDRSRSKLVSATYLRWREDCQEVRGAYARWTIADAASRSSAYRDYALALDEEEESAARLARLLGNYGAMDRQRCELAPTSR